MEVQPELPEARLLDGLVPVAAVVRPEQPPATRADEHAALWSSLGPSAQMVAKLRHDRRRHADLTHTRTRLRGPALDQAPRTSLVEPATTDEPSAQVEVVPAQLDQLPPPQPGERRHENKRSTPRTPGLRDRVDLIESRHRPLRALVLVCALDPARVPPQQLVINSGVHHRPQEPVRLRNGRCTRTVIQQVTTPALDPSWRQVNQIKPADPRVDLRAKRRLVPGNGATRR
jgi:hypothetical protein